MSRKIFCFIFLALFFSTSFASSKNLYFLCGPDEDGCPRDGYQYCLCVAFDEQEGMRPYCLDFDRKNCIAIKDEPNCNPGLIFANQANCIATLLQSEPFPGCPLKTRHFCEKHHVHMCEKEDPSCF